MLQREDVIEANRASRSRRWRLFLFAGILGLLVLYVGFDFWTGRRVRVVTERLEQRYGTLSEDSLRVGAVPAEENRARVVRAAAALGVPASNSVRAFISSVGKSEKVPPFPPEVQQFLEANRESLHVAATLTSRDRSSFEIEPDGSHGPDLLEIRTLSDAIFLSAMSDLVAGHPEEASKSIGAGLAVSASLRQENQLIAQLIRIAIAMRQIEAIQRVLAESEPSAAALDELAKRLAENRSPDPMRLGLVGELKTVHGMYSRLELGRVDATVTRPSLFRSILFRVGRPLVRNAHALTLERIEALLAVQSGPRPKGPMPEDGSKMTLWPGLSSVAGLARAVETGDDFTSTLGTAEIAVALRRYRIDRRVYPEELTPLVPTHLLALPIDPFTGKPPVYSRQGSGFMLQSQRYSPRGQPPWPPTRWVIGK